MKELLDLGWILKSLGITCCYDDGDEECEDSLHVSSGLVTFDIWYYPDCKMYELHYSYKGDLVYDEKVMNLIDTVLEVGTKVSNFGK